MLSALVKAITRELLTGKLFCLEKLLGTQLKLDEPLSQLFVFETLSKLLFVLLGSEFDLARLTLTGDLESHS